MNTAAVLALITTIAFITIVFLILKGTWKKSGVKAPVEQQSAVPQPEEKGKPRPKHGTTSIGTYILLGLVLLALFVGVRAAYRAIKGTGTSGPALTANDLPMCKGDWKFGHDYSRDGVKEIPLPSTGGCKSGWITFPNSWRSIQTARGDNDHGTGPCYWIDFAGKDIPMGPFDPDKPFLPGVNMMAPIRFRIASTCSVTFLSND